MSLITIAGAYLYCACALKNPIGTWPGMARFPAWELSALLRKTTVSSVYIHKCTGDTITHSYIVVVLASVLVCLAGKVHCCL